MSNTTCDLTIPLVFVLQAWTQDEWKNLESPNIKMFRAAQSAMFFCWESAFWHPKIEGQAPNRMAKDFMWAFWAANGRLYPVYRPTYQTVSKHVTSHQLHQGLHNFGDFFSIPGSILLRFLDWKMFFSLSFWRELGINIPYTYDHSSDIADSWRYSICHDIPMDIPMDIPHGNYPNETPREFHDLPLWSTLTEGPMA